MAASRHFWPVTAAAVLAAVLLAVAPQHLARAEGPEPVKVRIDVTDQGFNGNPGDFTVEVEQGKLVELTFVFAHVGYIEEEHIIVLEGYKLEWDRIDFHDREATLSFIADQPGTFTFKCDNDCDVHDYLQRGHLKVRRSSGEGAAAFTPTRLSLSPSTYVTGGEPVSILAALQDVRGAPVPKAEVSFFLAADFAGTTGELAIGGARTDANGVAFLEYRPTLGMRSHKIIARFAGMGTFDESQGAIEVQEVGSPPPAYTTDPAGLELFWRWGPRLLAVATVVMWAIIAFVAYQAVAIFRERGAR